jgi:membrane fusion protein (multidrug efflux system)
MRNALSPRPPENGVMAETVLKIVPRKRDETPDRVRTLPTEPATTPADSKIKRMRRRPRWPLTRKERVRWALFALLPLVLILGGYWYVTGGKIMSTDDAYVNARKVGISTDVASIVQAVDVTDNEHVSAGQVLYRLDPKQFQIALDNANANRKQMALSIDAMKQDYQHMLSDAAAEEAQVALDQTNYDRDAKLLRTGTVSQAVYDQAQYTLQTNKSKLDSLRQQAQTQLARLSGDPSIPTTEHPRYRQAQAQVAEAQRELDHTVVRAPFSGTVTDVPSIAPGKYLAASTTAFYLVDTDHVWVDANPKETDLTYVRAGQPAIVTVDTYPNVVWHGTVESISPSAAQEFSLLPAQNTSGNWVKVVQRVPMRVRVDTNDPKLPPLRAGMSVEVDVDTAHARGLPHFLTALFRG